MNIPQIQIATTNIKMDYSITNPQQTIKQPEADLTISQPAASLEISWTDAKVDINMDQMWKDLGIEPTSDVINRFAQEGVQGAMEGTARRAREGRQMMDSAGKGQGRATIQGIAKQNHGPHRAGPYNIKFVPSIGSVKVDITPGEVDINIEKNDPKIDVKVNKPIMDFTYGKVSGKMVQRPNVQIDVSI